MRCRNNLGEVTMQSFGRWRRRKCDAWEHGWRDTFGKLARHYREHRVKSRQDPLLLSKDAYVKSQGSLGCAVRVIVCRPP